MNRGRVAGWVEPLERRILLSAGLVKDINPGTPSSDPQDAVDINGELFFSANDGVHGPQLWKSDGTASGTSLVKVVDTTPPQNYEPARIRGPYELTNVNGTLYFVQVVGTDAKLYRSDGTANGTVAVTNLPSEAPISIDSPVTPPPDLTAASGKLYFLNNRGSGWSLWVTDPASATATQLAYVPLEESTTLPPITLIALGDTVVVDVEQPPVPTQPTISAGILYALSGGELQAIGPGPSALNYFFINGPFPPHSAVMNGTLYYLAGSTTPALYRSDGTTQGTLAVRQFSSDQFSSQLPWPSEQGPRVYAAGNKLLFTLQSGIWISDGTTAGTSLLAPNHELIGQPVVFNGHIYYTASAAGPVQQLFETDGTAAGTSLVHYDSSPAGSDEQLTVFGGLLYFTDVAGFLGQTLWQSDGTPIGARRVASLPSPATGDQNLHTTILGIFDGYLYFSPPDPIHGYELWTITSVPGDLNGDGTVGFDDLLVLARHYGQSEASLADGDLNGDHHVDFSDLVILARNYGTGGQGGSTASAALLPILHSRRRRISLRGGL